MKSLIIIVFVLVLPLNALAKSGVKKAPAFTLSTMADKKIKLKDFKGSVVLINFWASWCSPCVRQLPFLDSLSQTYGDRGLVVLGVSVDEERSSAKAFLNHSPVSYPVLHDEKAKISKAFQNITMPSSVLIDQNGDIVEVFPSFLAGGKDTLQQKIEALLEQ